MKEEHDHEDRKKVPLSRNMVQVDDDRLAGSGNCDRFHGLRCRRTLCDGASVNNPSLIIPQGGQDEKTNDRNHVQSAERAE